MATYVGLLSGKDVGGPLGAGAGAGTAAVGTAGTTGVGAADVAPADMDAAPVPTAACPCERDAVTHRIRSKAPACQVCCLSCFSTEPSSLIRVQRNSLGHTLGDDAEPDTNPHYILQTVIHCHQVM
jgi:hypothetical protein